MPSKKQSKIKYSDLKFSKTFPNKRHKCKKLAARRVKESWKVVPKDSIEVYKERRKRQTDSESKEDSNTPSNKNDDDNNTNRNSRRGTRRRGCNQRRNDVDSSSSSCYSTLSSCTSCSSYMNYE